MGEKGMLGAAQQAAQQFGLVGHIKGIRPYGSGHINDTFLVEGDRNCILQRMNRGIFLKPEEVMENILGVTTFLKKKIAQAGGNPERETLTVVPTKDQKPFYLDGQGEYWRMYYQIEGAVSYDRVERKEDFYESAVAFGNFQQLLADYPAETLHETIPGFHDTKARYEVFLQAVEADVCGRAKYAKEEIEFYQARKETACVLGELLAAGKLPLRVTHNDTKLNNILFDTVTKKALCIIDLDTVMPGLSLYDFGDAIRTGANTGAEDETDLSKIGLNLSLFETFTAGFLTGCAGSLTPLEIELLPMGAKLMTYECGIRFLADYLVGDVYFKIHREHHNLDRARTQFKLVADMEAKWEEMAEIVRRLSR